MVSYFQLYIYGRDIHGLYMLVSVVHTLCISTVMATICLWSVPISRSLHSLISADQLIAVAVIIPLVLTEA